MGQHRYPSIGDGDRHVLPQTSSQRAQVVTLTNNRLYTIPKPLHHHLIDHHHHNSTAAPSNAAKATAEARRGLDRPQHQRVTPACSRPANGSRGHTANGPVTVFKLPYVAWYYATGGAVQLAGQQQQ